MQLSTPQSAILSAVIFNALIIVFLIPLALRGVKYRRVSAAQLLRSNVFIYGLGGLLVPFKGIKIIDMLLVAINLGSKLIGQTFTDPGYFWGRPSATTPFPYNSEASSGSNMGPSNLNFLVTVKKRIALLREFDSEINHFIPVDLVTASGSGLDPEISPLAAFYQVPRIAKKRNISEKDLKILIHKHIQTRTLGILGEPRVNVLELNIALDK